MARTGQIDRLRRQRRDDRRRIAVLENQVAALSFAVNELLAALGWDDLDRPPNLMVIEGGRSVAPADSNASPPAGGGRGAPTPRTAD